ncbi:MAG: response regulator [Chloroflexi bacterium]|nr:MAG: response regulator [Chloroflexota bacterium]
MSDKIRVLIVDDLPETRENVRKLLQFESDVEVIGQAGTGEEAVEMAKEFQPDIILMDINMPGIDGIGASQKISELAPSVQIIIMSVQSDPNYLRRAMMAGARDFLTKPFGGDELVAAVRRVHEKRPQRVAAPIAQSTTAGSGGPAASSEAKGHIVTVFSPKGGAGCTTVSINLAVSLAQRNFRTVLVDGSLQFGDIEVMLHMKPMTSIIDVSDENTELDSDLISSVVQLHRSGVNVLLAPPRPEMAEAVNETSIKKLLDALRANYDFIIVDTSSYLTEVSLAILDIADKIVLVTQQSIPSLKSIKRFFDLGDMLEYSSGKTWLVVNRASKQGIPIKNIGNALKQPVVVVIPEDVIANNAADQGVPLVTGETKRRPISLAIAKLADHVVQELGVEGSTHESEVPVPQQSSGFMGKLFRRRVRAGG